MKTEISCLRNLHRILLPLLFLFLLNPAFSQRISELPAATYMGLGDLMPIVQNGVTKKLPFAGLTGSLHYLEDSLFVKYRCHKVKGASQWYFSGDTIFIDTCYISIPPGLGGAVSLYFSYGCNSGETKWYYSSDTVFLDTCFVAGGGDTCLFAINGDTIYNKDRHKVKFTDSVYFSNYCIPRLQEGEKFMGFLTLKSFVGDVKQLAFSTPKQAADSLAVNFDTLAYYQKLGDTTLYDATQYWVKSQNYLSSVPSSVIEWSDTTASAGVGIATLDDLRQLPSTTSLIEWPDTTAIAGVGLATFDDLRHLPPASGDGYAICFGSASISNGDGTVLYYMNANYSSTSSVARVYVPKSGTITTCYFWIWLGSIGSCSNEPMTCYIRLNNTTDYAIETVSTTDGGKLFHNTNMGISVVQGDYISIKSVNPTWATNPSGGMNGCTGIVIVQ